MYSRAHLLIERDLNEIINEPVDGILVFPLFEDNLFDIVAKIEGLPNTVWESGVFQIYLKFNEFYNDAPPLVSFQTIPFHPNIDVSTGRPALDFLDDINKWNSEYTIKFILQSLQQLLANPLLDRAVNIDAVFMLKGNPERYAKIAHESVIASQRIQKGLAPFPGGKSSFIRHRDSQSSNTNTSVAAANVTTTNNNSSNSAPATPLYSTHTVSMSATLPLTGIEGTKSSYIADHVALQVSEVHVAKNTKRISFEDYYRLWKGIATSKTDEASENIYIKYDLNQNPAQMAQHLGLTIKDLEAQMMQQLNDHKNVMYGKFNFKQDDSYSKKNTNEIKNDKGTNMTLNRINKMKNVYLNKNQDNNYPDGNSSKPSSISGGSNKLKTKDELSFVNEQNDYNVEKTPPEITRNDTKINMNSNWENEVDDLVTWTQNLNEQVI